MSAVVVFILFVICLVIAIPVSISLGIVAVLPGAFDPSFTASASYVIRSMLGGIDSFPLLAVPMFVLAGILMAFNVIKVAGWNKFAPIFIAIGVTSSVMGLITGEFFKNETVLRPFALWVTGLFGNPHAPILKLMPQSDPSLRGSRY